MASVQMNTYGGFRSPRWRARPPAGFATQYWGGSGACARALSRFHWACAWARCLGETQRKTPMNNGTIESPTPRSGIARENPTDELERVKRDLLKSEVKLAKARATVTTAEVDVRMLEARLRVLAK